MDCYWQPSGILELVLPFPLDCSFGTSCPLLTVTPSFQLVYKSSLLLPWLFRSWDQGDLFQSCLDSTKCSTGACDIRCSFGPLSYLLCGPRDWSKFSSVLRLRSFSCLCFRLPVAVYVRFPLVLLVLDSSPLLIVWLSAAHDGVWRWAVLSRACTLFPCQCKPCTVFMPFHFQVRWLY